MPRCHMHEWLRVKDVVARAAHVPNAFSETKLIRDGTECRFSWTKKSGRVKMLLRGDVDQILSCQ